MTRRVGSVFAGADVRSTQLAWRLGRRQILRVSTDPFRVSITGLSTDSLGGYGRIGTHASIGFTATASGLPIVPDAVKWSASADPAAAATFGTGASPTDFASADGFSVYLHVTALGETITRSFPVRRAPGTAPSIGAQTFTVDAAITAINAAASGAGLTFAYAAPSLPAGVSINASTGAVTGTPTAGAVGSGTAALTATDQYGRVLSYGFSFTASLRAQATGGADLDLAFTEDAAISPTNLLANWTLNGNTLSFVSVSPVLPAGLAINSAGVLSGTPTTVTTDATYTLTMADEYGRQTSDTFTLQITDVVVVPFALQISSTLPGFAYDLRQVQTPSGSYTLTGQVLPSWASVSGDELILTGDAVDATIVVRLTDTSGVYDLTLTLDVVTPSVTVTGGDAVVTYGTNDPAGTPYSVLIAGGIYDGETATWQQGQLALNTARWLIPPRVIITSGEGSGADAGRVAVGGVLTVDRPGLRAYLAGGTPAAVTGQWHDVGGALPGQTATALTVTSGMVSQLTYIESDGGPNVGASTAVQIVGASAWALSGSSITSSPTVAPPTGSGSTITG